MKIKLQIHFEKCGFKPTSSHKKIVLFKLNEQIKNFYLVGDTVTNVTSGSQSHTTILLRGTAQSVNDACISYQDKTLLDYVLHGDFWALISIRQEQCYHNPNINQSKNCKVLNLQGWKVASGRTESGGRGSGIRKLKSFSGFTLGRKSMQKRQHGNYFRKLKK